MLHFIAFAFYLCVSCFLLITVPVMMVPGLSMKRKVLICGFAFLVLVPAGLALYAWLGAPQLAIDH